MKVDILIPSCKKRAECEKQINAIEKTRLTEGNVIFTGQEGSAAMNRNEALKQAKAEVIIMMDDDMKGFYEGWDVDLISPLAINDVLIVSARLMKADGSIAYSCIENNDLKTRYIYSQKLPTACIAFRSTDVRFDEGYIGSGFEDDDWCRTMFETYGYDKTCVTVNACKLVHINEAKNQSGFYWSANKNYFQMKWRNVTKQKPIALCKTWRGKEFSISAIEAIYHHMDKIVFVHSDISWTGERGNDVKPVIEEWKKHHDNEDKIINLQCNTQDQEEQYRYGINYITKKHQNEFAFFFDTDEVWPADDLSKLLTRAKEYPEYDGFCVGMHTYIKSPFYRITPQEPNTPFVLYRLASNTFAGPRGTGIKKRIIFKDLHFHHFTYVRENEETLFTKIKNIYEAEKDAYGHVNLDQWKKEKWDRLPEATNFHTAKGFETFWKGIQVVGMQDLPMKVRNNELVKKWEEK